MNKHLLLFTGILVLAMFTSACSGIKDLDSPDFSQATNNTIVFACESSWGDNQTIWNESHRIGMFCEQTGTTNLPLGASAVTIGEQIGLFYTKIPWSKKNEEHLIYLYSPYKESNTSTTISGQLSDTQLQNGTSTSHIESNNLMYATIKSNAENKPINTPLKYAFDIIDIAVISAQTTHNGWSVKSITLTSIDLTPLTGTYSFDLETGIATIITEQPSLTVKVAGAPALTVGEPFHAYAAINLPKPIQRATGIACKVAVTLSKEEASDMLLEGDITLTPGVKTLAINTDDLEGAAIEDNSINLSDPNSTNVSITANCYVANIAGQSYRFPATVMGNGVTTPATNNYTGTTGIAPGIIPTKLAPMSAKLLWQTSRDLITDIELKKDHVYFTLNGSATTPLVEGNAVIAVYDENGGAGNILWSWHIWVTAANLTSSLQTYTLPGSYSDAGPTVVMDRNLGSFKTGMWGSNNDNLAFGLLYQWGRKDPFQNIDDTNIGAGGAIPITRLRKTYDASGTEISVDNKATDIGAGKWLFVVGKTMPYSSINKYPMCFTALGNTWLDEARDDLWGNPFSTTINDIGKKSIYDPCPPGYRVPHRYFGAIGTTDGENSTKGTKPANPDAWNGSYTEEADIKTKGGNILPFGSGNAEYSLTGMLFINGGAVVPFRAGSYCGHYQVSMPTTDIGKSYRFYLDYVSIKPNDNNARYIGGAVRCMKE